MITPIKSTLFVVVITFAWTLSAPTKAQGQDNAERPEIEEVIVTAQRRSQSLQELPIAASAVTGESLNDNQIAVIDDLAKITPALTINDFGVGKSVNIRGVGKNIEAPGVSAGVAYYVDGVPLANSIFLNTPFFDLERVEVLRGPQGTLVGMNSTGGALLIVSKDPDPDATEGSIEISQGDYSNTRVRGMINLPTSERMAFRIAAEHESRDSFFDNDGPARGEPGKVDRSSVRAAFGGDLSDTVSLFLRGEYSENETDGFTGKPIPGDPGGPPNPVPYFVLLANSPADEFSLARDVSTRDDSEYYRISANLSVDVGDTFEFRSVTAYQDGERNIFTDGDSTSLPTTSVQIDIWEEALSQEFNLISTSDGSFDWVVGAFYLDLETEGFVEPRLIPFGGAEIVQVFGNSTTKNWGVFGQGTFNLSDDTNLTIGLRYNDEESTNPGGRIQTFGPPGVPGPVFPESIFDAEDEAVTGRLTLDHQFNQSHFGYVTVSRGFKGGGTNSAPLPAFDSETIWNYELGLKSEFLDGQVRSQLGLFRMDFEDIQRSVFNPTTPQLSGIGNFAEAEIYGFEYQLQVQVGGFGLDLAIGYTESEIDNASIVDDRYDPVTPVNLDGNSLSYIPEWTVSLGIDYTAYLADGIRITPRARISYAAEQWANEFQVRPTDRIDSYSLVDASIKFDSESSGWYAEIYASNLLDEEWIAAKSTFATTPGRVEFYGAPRQYGARVGYSF